MAERMNENKLLLSGRMEAEAVFSHAVRGVQYDRFRLCVKRSSGIVDVLPVLINHALLPAGLGPGSMVELTGRLRSRVFYSGDGTERLMLNAWAGQIALIGELPELNEVYLTGAVVRPPIYRTTPRQREIADLFLSVPRAFGREDLIPVIAWGQNARWAAELSAGERVQITGRLQSRVYQKRLPSGECVERVTYEVSAATLRLPEPGPE